MEVIGVLNAHITATCPTGKKVKTTKIVIVEDIKEVYLSFNVMKGLGIVDRNFQMAAGIKSAQMPALRCRNLDGYCQVQLRTTPAPSGATSTPSPGPVVHKRSRDEGLAHRAVWVVDFQQVHASATPSDGQAQHRERCPHQPQYLFIGKNRSKQIWTATWPYG